MNLQKLSQEKVLRQHVAQIGDGYLLEIELNDYTKQLLKDLKSMDEIKLYKRIQSWKNIYKMADTTVKSS
ncbi:MAG: hypothetical protein RSD47_10140 [Romboutsia sp.]